MLQLSRNTVAIALVALLVGVVIFAALSAYFQQTTVDLLSIIGLFADAIGIVTGLLGIWFYFISEKLNRDSAINLERTKAATTRLSKEMYAIIEQVLEAYIKQTQHFQTDLAFDKLKDKIEANEQYAAKPEVMEAIDAIKTQVDTYQQQQAIISRLDRTRLELLNHDDQTQGHIGLLVALLATKCMDHHPSPIRDLISCIEPVFQPQYFGHTEWSTVFRQLIDSHYLDVVTKADEYTNVIVRPGRRLEAYR